MTRRYEPDVHREREDGIEVHLGDGSMAFTGHGGWLASTEFVVDVEARR